jgi:membrane-bound serine protease (ClpP class)
MLRFFVQLVLIASLNQSLVSSFVAAQPPLPNIFEPLSQETASEKTGRAEPVAKDSDEAQPQSNEQAAKEKTPVGDQAVAQPDPAAEGDLKKPAAPGMKDNAEVDPAAQPPKPDNTMPVAVATREDLLTAAFKKPYIIEINAEIDGFFEWFIDKSLEQAKEDGADLILIKLTTPGGNFEISRLLSQRLLEIDWAKTAMWIPDEAISGGAILSLGADAIYMKKSAMFGDAGPVYLTEFGNMVDAEEKVASYVVEKIRLLAKDSKRPMEIAAAMADRKLKVFRAQEKATGLPAFVNEAQSKRAEVIELFEIGEPVPEAGNNRFLTVGSARAKELLLCDEFFDSEGELLKRLSPVEPVRLAVSKTDPWVYMLVQPFFTALILVVGVICLYIEMTAPGATLPGLISMLCFGLFFWSHVLGGTATGLEIMLFLIGTLALFLEIFVFPGFGVFGVAGMIMVATSLLMATQSFVIPQTNTQWEQFEVNGLSLVLVGIVVTAIVAVQFFWFDSIPGLSRLQLKPEEVASTAPVSELHPASTLAVGARGICTSDLRPSGRAMIEGTLVDVLSEGDYVEAQTEISVIRIEGNIVTVRKVNG